MKYCEGLIEEQSYLSYACFRALDHLGSVGALSRPTFGFYARPQVPLARTRAVGPRVRDLYVGVAPDLCVSGRCPSMLLAINRNFPRKLLILESHPFVCCVLQACLGQQSFLSWWRRDRD